MVQNNATTIEIGRMLFMMEIPSDAENRGR
jgi:hypothetical protein